MVFIPFLSMTIGIVLLYTLLRMHAASERLLITSYDIRGHSRVLLRAASEAEAGVYGFAVSRDDEYLRLYRTAAAQVRPALAELSGAIGTDPASQSRLSAVSRLIYQLLNGYAEMVGYLGGTDARGTTTGLPELMAGQQVTIDEIRTELQALEAEQNRKLETSLERQERFRFWFQIAAPVGWFVALLSILMSAWLFLAGILRRVKELEAVYTAQGPLTEPPSGNDEISRLGRALFDASSQLAAREQALRSAQAAAAVAREQAESANRAKSDFLSRMSHELRTPLNAILGFTQLLQMDELTPDQRESTNQVLKSGKHLLGLINDVLDIARIESGRLTLSLEPVSVALMLEETLDMVRLSAEQRNITVHAAPTDSRLYVTADNQRTKQVLLNLLSNAIKYNRAGGRVMVRAHLSGDGWVRMEVSDTGFGIPAHKSERLFMAFERLGAEATEIEGTGIGLALSRSLVETMGGRIGVASRENEGSTFWVELPRSEAPSAGEEPDLAPETAPPARFHARKLILYLEDNMSNYTLLERAFRPLSEVELMGALQGRVGLELARAKVPDLILLDLHLPDMHGSQVLLELKADPVTAAIPVIILSADASPSQAARLTSGGAAAYLTKPLDLSRLLETVRTQLELGGDARASRTGDQGQEDPSR